jgi:DNA-binding SARP family transcriptional activator
MLEQTKMLGAIATASLPATGQLVFDYLAGEIFQKSDAGTQEFLLRTAYPSFLTASMARALTGVEDAGGILEGLHRNNYFVSQRPGRPEPVYQFHPMMREFLRARLEEAYTREQRRLLQKQSAGVMEGADSPEDALALYRDAHEWDEMARVIGNHAETLIAQGRGETARRWIEELPPDVPLRHPWIVYWAASSQAQLAPRESRQLYEKAFDLFAAREEPDRTGMMLASSGALDAILYELDDLALMDRWIAVLDVAVKGGAPFPSATDEARVACSMFIAATLRQPHRPDIPDWIARALARSEETPDPNLRMFVSLLAALTCMWAGLYDTAHALLESMRRQASGARISPFSLTTLKNVEAMYYMLTADKEQSLRSMREGLEIMRATGAQTWLIQLHVNGYGAALGAQDLETAAALAKEFESQSEHAGRFNLCLFRHFRAWEAMLRKDPLRALQEQKQALRMAIDVGCPFFEVLCRLGLAEILAELGDERKAISHLQQLRSIVAAIDNRHLEFTCLIGFGRLAVKHGRQTSGNKALRRGLALGREHGYTHFLGWRPSALSQVCAYALESGIEVDYVRDLIRRRNLAPEESLVSLAAWPWPFRVRTFGTFELLKNDEPLATSGKAQKRPLELLKVLLAAGGEQVSESHVTEAMWPRIDGDSAHRSFTSTLHRLRKMLGEDRAIVLHEGRLTVDRHLFWVDAWEFARVVEEVDAAFRGARAQVDAVRVERLSDRLIELYRGPMLASDLDDAWLIQPRERQRARFIRAMTHIGRHWEGCGEWERALACYERCLEADPLAEAFYRYLIIGFQRLERRGEAIEAYNRCRKALATLGVEPSSETRALYEGLSAAR